MESGGIQIEYRSSSKTIVKGFSYLIPKEYGAEFTEYLVELSAEDGPNLPKNYSKVTKTGKKQYWLEDNGKDLQKG